MAILRLRYQKGQFIPLGDVEGIEEGDEFEIELPLATPHETLQETLDRTAGLWTDWPEDIEGLIEDARQKWDEEWQQRLNSL